MTLGIWLTKGPLLKTGAHGSVVTVLSGTWAPSGWLFTFFMESFLLTRGPKRLRRFADLGPRQDHQTYCDIVVPSV